MTSDVAVVERNEVKETLLKSLFPNLSEAEAVASYEWAKKRGLSVEARQCYPLKLGGKVQMFPSIDGLRVVAERTKKYGGSGDARFFVRFKDGTKAVVPHEQLDMSDVAEIISATISVYRKDFTTPLSATALFRGYAKVDQQGRPQNLWATMPDAMILKCAESLALRKAFPEVLSGMYTVEEMEQATNESRAVVTPARKQIETKVMEVEKQESTVWEKFCDAIKEKVSDYEPLIVYANEKIVAEFGVSPDEVDEKQLRPFLKKIWESAKKEGIV